MQHLELDQTSPTVELTVGEGNYHQPFSGDPKENEIVNPGIG